MKSLCSGFTLQQETTMNQLFNVEGMTCGHCEKAVAKALLTLDPQAQITIDRSQNKVQVDSAQPRDKLRQVIADEGYTVQA
jgi:copper chaperone